MTKFTPHEEHDLWERWKKEKHPDDGDALVARYMPLVTFHSRRIASTLPKAVSREEITSFGLSGLYDALLKFEPSRDLKFDTYASFRIRGAILDGLRKADWLPRAAREKSKKIEAAVSKLEQRYLRTVTAEEVAEELGITADDVHDTMAEHFFSHVLSTDEQVNELDQQDGSGFAIKDEKTMSPEDELVKHEQINELTAQIEKLTEKEQLVIDLFYKEELTLTEIGEILGLSTSRISQIHSKALFKLKQQLIKTR
ncbi:FliA/WhiG family RNA polymerase sigma factor [Domibacillus epiphyticus]|uniref:RNA polymerase subunit sigma n=1 Tax=Domibacillus epiphyticus TaxID=1714355 RepID=A0A1V2ACD9_9BACI|nr:FliA/WhiG family RNA polymerase sigma factor [Domibacillus epiphyticus]OMP68627.1 RNA polymerase subunit sigma [Domibacillus epiphyticus]